MSETDKTTVIFLGDTGVGKSAIIQAKINREFNVQNTIGIDSKYITVDGEILTIYDTAGQERYRSIVRKYYVKAKIAILVFDLCSRQSFESIDHWYEELTENCNEENFKVVLVGNKSDLDDPQISEDEAEQKAEKVNAFYIPTSAKTLTNIDELFSKLADISKEICQASVRSIVNDTVNIEEKEKQSSCC